MRVSSEKMASYMNHKDIYEYTEKWVSVHGHNWSEDDVSADDVWPDIGNDVFRNNANKSFGKKEIDNEILKNMFVIKIACRRIRTDDGK